jgi:hypothetical protein
MNAAVAVEAERQAVVHVEPQGCGDVELDDVVGMKPLGRPAEAAPMTVAVQHGATPEPEPVAEVAAGVGDREVAAPVGRERTAHGGRGAGPAAEPIARSGIDGEVGSAPLTGPVSPDRPASLAAPSSGSARGVDERGPAPLASELDLGVGDHRENVPWKPERVDGSL